MHSSLPLLLLLSLFLFVSLIDGAAVLTGLTGDFQSDSTTNSFSFTPYLYPRLNNISSTYEYNLLVPPLPSTDPTAVPRFRLTTTGDNGVFIVLGYVINAATLKLSRGSNDFESQTYDPDNFDSALDTFRQANNNANANNRGINLPIKDFSSRTEIFAQVYDPTLGTRSTYWIHTTVAVAEDNVELVIAMDFSFKCDDPNFNFIDPLTAELRNNLGSLASVTTINVQSADCSSDFPSARFSIKSSGSIVGKSSGYDVYVELLKNIRNPIGNTTYYPTASTVRVAQVNTIPIPPPPPSSANKNLAIIVGVCGAVAAIFMAGIFIFFHKKKQSGQWNADKENVSLAGTKDIETAV